MKNFNNSWRNFLNEGSRTENVPFEDTRVRIKLENKKNLLHEVTEDEFEHIERAIEEMPLEELAFQDIFGDKTRIITDFPTPDTSTPLGKFVTMWLVMGYEVDWKKGMLSSMRRYTDSSPEAMAQEITTGNFGGRRSQDKRVNMKIGKWFSKMLGYVLKYDALKVKVHEHVQEHGDWPRVTGNDIQAALGENGAKNYYRLGDTIDMMIKSPDDVTPQYIKELRRSSKLEELSNYWRDNAAEIKANLDKAQSNEYSIIITRNPIDVWRMSDFQNITSCHTPPSRGGGGEYYKCAVAEAHGHGAVAYAVDTEELLQATESSTLEEAENKLNTYSEIFYDDERTFGGPEIELKPDMRVRLRQVRYFLPDEQAALKKKHATIGDMPDPETHSQEEIKAWLADVRGGGGLDHNAGVQIAVPERRTYGAKIPGFNERIIQWARENQEVAIAEAPKTESGELELSKFIKFGGTHDDNPMSRLLPRLFGDTITGTEGHVQYDSTTEDEIDDSDLIGGLQTAYQREVDERKAHWNNRMAYVEVNGEAIDDGGGGVYITCGATLFINWDASEWERLPNAITIGYGLQELKDYGMGWVVDHPAWPIQKKMDGNTWQLRIAVNPQGLAGFDNQEYAYDPDMFDRFCDLVDGEVDDKYNAVHHLLTKFFMREGYMEGGAMMELGREVMNEDTGLLHWEAVAEEGYEHDEYEFIQFTAHPEVWYAEMGASEEQAMQIMNDRNFWIEIKKRMAAPAFEAVGSEMYPQMPLDMDMFGEHGTEEESQELNLYFSVHDGSPDEQVKVLKELVNLWDDQDEINRVASEVFQDMLQGTVSMDGTAVGDLREEKKLLEIDQMLNELTSIDVSGHKPKIDNLMRMEPEIAKELVMALDSAGVEARWAYKTIQRVKEINQRIGELEKLGVHYTGYGTVHGTQEQHDEMMNLMNEFNKLAGIAGSYEKQFNKQADRAEWEYNRKIRNSDSLPSLNEAIKQPQTVADLLGLVAMTKDKGWANKCPQCKQWLDDNLSPTLLKVAIGAGLGVAMGGILPGIAGGLAAGAAPEIADGLRKLFAFVNGGGADVESIDEFPILKTLKVDPQFIDLIDNDLLNSYREKYLKYLTKLPANRPLNRMVGINDYIRNQLAVASDGALDCKDAGRG